MRWKRINQEGFHGQYQKTWTPDEIRLIVENTITKKISHEEMASKIDRKVSQIRSKVENIKKTHFDSDGHLN